jgi:hypothetical protein
VALSRIGEVRDLEVRDLEVRDLEVRDLAEKRSPEVRPRMMSDILLEREQ